MGYTDTDKKDMIKAAATIGLVTVGMDAKNTGVLGYHALVELAEQFRFIGGYAPYTPNAEELAALHAIVEEAISPADLAEIRAQHQHAIQ